MFINERMKNVSLDECKGKTDKAKKKGVVSLSSFNRLLLTQDPGKKRILLGAIAPSLSFVSGLPRVVEDGNVGARTDHFNVVTIS